VQHMEDLDRKLPALLRGELRPEPAERAEFASLCQQPWKQLFAAAGRLYEEAFTARPELAEDLEHGHRYNAACAAALAGCGPTKDEPPLDDQARARWRKQALVWLRADLAAYAKRLGTGRPENRRWVAGHLHWAQQDNDLAGVRDPAALAQLPDGERQQWRTLWSEVAALLKQAQEKP
jgi:serine/threonine-protein kinase